MKNDASSAPKASEPLVEDERGTVSVPEAPQPARSNISPLKEARKRKTVRSASVDILRGLTVFSMLLVNNKPAHMPAPDQLTHASWSEGLHFADMIFPWFVFLMGLSIAFSSRASRNDPRRFYIATTRRALILVLLGCLINSSYVGHPMFDFGVLQIIGLSYFFAALMGGWRFRYRVAAAAMLLTAHWAAMRFYPVPGLGAGVVEEGSNFILYMNQKVLRPIGLDGVLSVITPTALALIGTGVGDIMRREKFPTARGSATLVAIGAAMVLGGLLWSLDLRFSKPLWTASYVVFAAGWATIALGLFHYVADVRGFRAWTFPFVVFSSNAIVAFVAPILVNVHILREWMWRMPDGAQLPVMQFLQSSIMQRLGPFAGAWMFLTLFIGFWWLVLFNMYRKKIFIKV